MKDKIRVVIAGIGGVGGYFGGLLARAYAGNEGIEIDFIARGKHLHQIQNNGLKVIKGAIEFIAIPSLATDNVNNIGIADYILVSTKNYDLAEILDQLTPCISEKTVIVPLLNGVEAVEKIRSKFPKNLVPSGCAYIVSAIKEPGIIENVGNRQEIYFGLDNNETDVRLSVLLDLLKSAGIEANLSTEISKLIWEKFIFLSVIATATSYYQKTVGELLAENRGALQDLIGESIALAKAKEITVDNNAREKAMAHYEALPYSATSSMQRDFEAKNTRTELETITGYVFREAKKLNIQTPNFEQAYISLLKRDSITS